MNCAESRPLLSSLADGELPAAEANLIREHLGDCPECRAAAETLRGLDFDLRSAFAGDRRRASAIAENVLAAVSTGVHVGTAAGQEASGWNGSEQKGPVRQRTAVRRAAGYVAAAVAGFALATVLQGPADLGDVLPAGPIAEDGVTADGVTANTVTADAAKARPPAVDAPPVARLVYVTGDVGVRRSAGDAWQSVVQKSLFAGNADCDPSGSVRTGPGVLCEVRTSSGGVVRLNESSEVKVVSDAEVEVVRGEVWCRASATTPLKVAATGATAGMFTVSGASRAGEGPDVPSIPSFTCPTNSESLLACTPPEAPRVTATAGEIDVTVGDRTRTLPPGRVCTLGDGDVLVWPAKAKLLSAERWMLPLITRSGHDNPELRRRVDALLAELSASETTEAAESELRTLGEYAAPLLLRSVHDGDGELSPELRRRVMAIAADTAPSWMVPDLVTLLSDADGTVRGQAAQGLKRVTGVTMGRSIEGWRSEGESDDARAAVTRWRDWWEANRLRCPQPPGVASGPFS